MLAEKKYPGDAEAFSKLEKLISEGKDPAVSGVTVCIAVVNSVFVKGEVKNAYENVPSRNDNYRPPTKLGEGNVFTGVCLFTGGGYPWY